MFRRIAKPAEGFRDPVWDQMAETRHAQLYQGYDAAQCRVICPTLCSILKNIDVDTVCDFGCGVGYLGNLLSRTGLRVTGIDTSQKSIDIASQESIGNANFICCDVDALLGIFLPGYFDLIIANLVIMNIANLSDALSKWNALLKPSGYILITITNPATWPRVCAYEDADWFRYDEEIFVAGPFRISSQKHLAFDCWHAHRPLSLYQNELFNTNFDVIKTFEPFPKRGDEVFFHYKWTFPRYIIILAKKR